jgi:hypothetical protein
MGYSIAKMIEFALSYILNNELKTQKYELPTDTRQTLMDYMTKRIEEIRSQYK